MVGTGNRASATARWWVVVLAAAALACGRTPGAGAEGALGDDSASTSAVAPRSAPPPLSWRFESPPSWDDRVRVSAEPEAGEALAAQGIRSARHFEYLPRDTTVVPQTLLGIYAYDSTAWARLAEEAGPPQGEVILQAGGVTYVAGLPQSNPFAPGSADFAEFARRAVTMRYVRGAFRAVP